MNARRGLHQSLREGLSLVELLVAMAIVGMILLIVGAFFASQARISTDLQERNELSIRLRAVAEGVAQDLQMAGARAYVEDGVPSYVEKPMYDEMLGSCGALGVGCEDEKIESSVLSVFYASSLRPQLASEEKCRNVVYRLADGGTLYRADVNCGVDTFDSLPDFPTEFATGIQLFELTFECMNGEVVPEDPSADVESRDPADCFTSERRGVRSGTIEIVGTSRSSTGRTESLELSVSMSNTREFE